MFKRTFGNFGPRMSIFFIVMLAFSLMAFFFNRTLGLIQLLLTLAIIMLFMLSGARKSRFVSKYIESVITNADAAAKASLTDCPLPMIIARSDGDVLWCNEGFEEVMAGEPVYGRKVKELIPDYDGARLVDIKEEERVLHTQISDRFFDIYGSFVKSNSESTGAVFTVLYLVERTDAINAKDQLGRQRMTMANIMVDNLEEIAQDAKQSERAAVLATVDEILTKWAESAHGILRGADQGRYMFFFEEQYLKGYIDSKFDILDKIREVNTVGRLPVTISIGIGRGGESFAETGEFARQALEMALGRGGDQAAIKTGKNFEFFGGKSKTVEKRTKVKSRVMSSAMEELIENSDKVIVMGHKFADFDSIGSGIGVARMAKIKKKPVYIIVNRNTILAKSIIEKFEKIPEYEGVMIDQVQALDALTSRTLLVIVDTHSPMYIEAPEVYENCRTVVVIDHHRRMVEYIDNAALTYHEPYASSASEIVAEILQYMDSRNTLMKEEAEAMLAGMVLDTKNFYFKTGFRTFEAASYLRRAGADMIEVKKLFQFNHESYIKRTELITAAQFYRGNIAISVWDGGRLDDAKVVMAQAADELLNIEGVDASFVLYPFDERNVHISARSLGTVNVQVITEFMGGGGHQTNAGAQLADVSIEDAKVAVRQAIDKYYETQTASKGK